MTRQRIGIRTRITGGSLLIAVLISVIAGIIIFGQVQRIVDDGQDSVLENVEAPYLTALTEEGAEEVDPPGPQQLAAVIDPSGRRRIDTLPSALGARLDTIVGGPDGTTRIPVESGSYLVRSTTVDTATGAWHVISAVDDAVQSSILNQVALLLVVSIAGINIAFGAASWFIGGAALGPVTRLRRSAEEIARTPSDELLPVGEVRDEISELAHTLNELIGQLRASAERERQIVSDASHEFRTPLAIMTTQLELAQADATTLDGLRGDVAAVQRTLARLTSLATSMLELSRLDAQVAPGTSTFDDLAAELADSADRGRQRVSGRDVRIDYEAETGPSLQIAVSVADFGRACDNLIANALAAVGAVGTVRLDLRADSETVVLQVSDDAGGMPTDFVPHAFDRFSRADRARTGGGAGLGLPLVRGIARLAGGTAELVNRPGDGLTVVLRFPVVGSETAERPAER